METLTASRGLAVFVTLASVSTLACSGAKEVANQAKQTAVDVGQRVTEPPMPCDKAVNAAAPVSCVSGRIECGQTIESTTEGGESNWDDDFYAAKFCIPALDGHPGPERVYVLEAPAQAGVDVRLVSDCVDLDLIGLRFGYQGNCPGIGHAVPQCEGDDHRGGGRIHIETFDRSEQWLIGVDGKAGATGTFRLYVECDFAPR